MEHGLSTPWVVVLSGPAAAGKNAIAEKVCQLSPSAVANVDLDTVKEFVFGAPKTDAFLDLASEIGRAMLRAYVASGISVVVHKAFCEYRFAKPFIELAGNMGVTCGYFKLTAPLEVLLERNARRGYRSTQDEIRRIYASDQANAHDVGTSIDTSLVGIDEAAAFIWRCMEARSHSAKG